LLRNQVTSVLVVPALLLLLAIELIGRAPRPPPAELGSPTSAA
jgi:hypothetical protein